MNTNVSDFNYTLPRTFIAQSPASPRESARLMVLNRQNKTIHHYYVSDLPTFFRRGDVLVVNNTKVFRARLHGTTDGKSVELFLIRPAGDTRWQALGKPGKKMSVGKQIFVAKNFVATVLGKHSDGTLTVDFRLSATETIARANQFGEVPVPPYIKTIPKASDYQTSYAKREGSVAAPTAGFHFTPAILKTLKKKGVEIVAITLHVGLGTFLPIKTETIEEHAIHSEWVDVSKKAAETINRAKEENRRIVAVGTTTVRTLEGVAKLYHGKLRAYEGDVRLFITPGYQFLVVDSMVTNFHLPKSTLIVLVSGFSGREFILKAYKEAIEKNYRFYSFGDAMLIA